MPVLADHVHTFFTAIRTGKTEIYNEFSLQHEFGAYLRSVLAPDSYKVQFERPTDFFGIASAQLLKKEIDIAIFSLTSTAVEVISCKKPGSFWRNDLFSQRIV
jgi:hypothetical protein